MYRLFFTKLILLLTLSPLFAQAPAQFMQAKKVALTLFSNHPETLYCACKYSRHKEIDLDSCNMKAAKPFPRAHRLEWEHMMPAENFGRHFKCWREPICISKKGKPYRGRKCCEKIDAQFQKAEAELYNLWPAVGLVNQARSNYRFSPLPARNGHYGCDFEVDPTLRKVEPPNRAKGVVARANLFMAEHYHIRLSSSQRKLFEAWNKEFPPTAWEKTWANEVAKIEGYHNTYIERWIS